VGTHTTVAVTVKRRCIAAVPAVPLTGDQIDEGGIFGLLHGSLTLRRMGKSAVVGEPPLPAVGCSFGPGSTGTWPSIGGQAPIAKRVFPAQDVGGTRRGPLDRRRRPLAPAEPARSVYDAQPGASRTGAIGIRRLRRRYAWRGAWRSTIRRDTSAPPSYGIGSGRIWHPPARTARRTSGRPSYTERLEAGWDRGRVGSRPR
jgi:hypothetical protein